MEPNWLASSFQSALELQKQNWKFKFPKREGQAMRAGGIFQAQQFQGLCVKLEQSGKELHPESMLILDPFCWF